jgi:hypothetical protein
VNETKGGLRSRLGGCVRYGLPSQNNHPYSAASYGPQKGNAVSPRIRDRLKALEARIAPKSRIFVFFRAEGPDLPPYAEQLAEFKAKQCVVTTDILLIVSFQQGSEGNNS